MFFNEYLLLKGFGIANFSYIKFLAWAVLRLAKSHTMSSFNGSNPIKIYLPDWPRSIPLKLIKF